MTAANEATDAKIGAAEARFRGEMGVALAELLARIDLGTASVNAKLTHIEEQNRSLRANVWSAAAFVVGSMIAIIALLATVVPYAFDKGADFHDRVAREVNTQLARRYFNNVNHPVIPANAGIQLLLAPALTGVAGPPLSRG